MASFVSAAIRKPSMMVRSHTQTLTEESSFKKNKGSTNVPQPPVIDNPVVQFNLKLGNLPQATPDEGLRRPSQGQGFVRRMSNASQDGPIDLRTIAEAGSTTSRKGWVVHPYSPLRYHLDVVLISACAYSAIMLPLQFAALVTAEHVLIIILDQLVNLAFLIDLLLGFRTGYIDLSLRTLVLEPKLIARHYVRGWFAMDLLTTIPFDLAIHACADRCSAESAGLPTHWAMRVLSFVRLGRLLRLTRIRTRLMIRSGMLQVASIAVRFSAWGFFMVHLAACLWFTIGANVGTWIVAEDPQNKWSLFDAYIAALYWSLQTVSTIGFGDVGPGNTAERIFAMLVMLLGSITYAYGITSVITLLMGLTEHQRRLMSQHDQLNRYILKMNVPPDLRTKLREYFVHYQNAFDSFNEASMLRMLSPGLRASLISLANAPLLRKVSFFADADEACVNEMAMLLVPNLFVPDEVILIKGNLGEDMYVIKNGMVRVYLEYTTERKQELATLGPATVFGEGALLKGKSALRAATVVAASYSLIYALHVDAMNSILRRYPGVKAKIEEVAVERERSTATLSVRWGNGPEEAAARRQRDSDGSREDESVESSANGVGGAGVKPLDA